MFFNICFAFSPFDKRLSILFNICFTFSPFNDNSTFINSVDFWRCKMFYPWFFLFWIVKIIIFISFLVLELIFAIFFTRILSFAKGRKNLEFTFIREQSWYFSIFFILITFKNQIFGAPSPSWRNIFFQLFGFSKISIFWFIVRTKLSLDIEIVDNRIDICHHILHFSI